MMIKNIVDDLPKHASKKYGRRNLDSVKYIVLHHSGVDGSIESFANYHVSKGWPGIGYHFVIKKDGNIFCTNRIKTISYNVGGHNTKVIGICVVGNYDNEELSETLKDNIKNLIEMLRGLLGPLELKGHNELKATLCPGKNITEFIKTLNNDS